MNKINLKIMVIVIIIAGMVGSLKAQSPFSETGIQNSNSSSPYATTENVFSPANQYGANQELNGECTWYVYGRVIELVGLGYLDEAVSTALYNSFSIYSGRHANNWDDLLSGNWISTNTNPVPYEQRRAGYIVQWESGDYGHVAFVEEVSNDLSQYRVSEFNLSLDHNYGDSYWLPFEGDDKHGMGVYPKWYALDFATSSNVSCTFSVYADNSGPFELNGWKYWEGVANNYYHVLGSISGLANGSSYSVYLANTTGTMTQYQILSNKTASTFEFDFGAPAGENGGDYKFVLCPQGNPNDPWDQSGIFYLGPLPNISISVSSSTLVIGEQTTASWHVTGGISGLPNGGWTGDIRLQWYQNNMPLENLISTPVANGSYTFIVPFSISGANVPGSNFRIAGVNAALGTSIPNGYVSSYSKYFDIESPAIPIPTNVFASNNECGQITLSWNTVSEATSYQVYRDNSPLSSDYNPPYIDTDVDNSVTYSYFIRAVNSNGESGNSNAVIGSALNPIDINSIEYAVSGDGYDYSFNADANWDSEATIIYDWDFGDGSSHSNAVSPIHRYQYDDSYIIELLMRYENGICASETYTTGIINVVSIKDVQTPNDYVLHNAFPNPFNPSTTVQYELPQISEVTIRIFDLSGHEVKLLVDDSKNPGWHTVQWSGDTNDGYKVETGVYFVHFSAGSYSQVIKIVYLR